MSEERSASNRTGDTSFQDFVRGINVVPRPVGERLRGELLRRRLDPQLIRESGEALALRSFHDGDAYEGYIWDYLAEKEVLDEASTWARVSAHSQVYVMWDLHSSEKVRIPGYFRFPSGTVLQGPPDSLRRGAAFLPEDLYVFDSSLTWVAALTHEYVRGSRYCIWSGIHPW